MKRFKLSVLLLILALAWNSCAQTTVSTAVESITQQELKEHLYFLASDSLRGRVTGTSGFQTAARYCDRMFREAGLQTVLSDSAGNPSFLQPVPFIRDTPDDGMEIIVTTPAGVIILKEGPDFKFLISGNRTFPREPVPAVFIGYGIEEPNEGWNDFEGLDLSGKVVIMLDHVPEKDGEPLLSQKLHKRYKTGRGDERKLKSVLTRNPTAILQLASKRRADRWDRVGPSSGRAQVSYAGVSSEEEEKEGLFRIWGRRIIYLPHVLETLFKDQPYNPYSDSTVTLEGYHTFELKDVTMHSLSAITASEFNSWNVVGMVEGSDPELKHEYITVGAHLDHVAPRGGDICNGADDNASGSVGVLEVAEAVAMAPPKRSVLFILYTAEEMGLLGSKHFVNNCPVPLEQVKVNINLDMIGRDDPNVEEHAHYVVGSESVNPELKKIIADVNERTVNWPLLYRRNNQIGGRSDHRSFDSKGIPAFFFFSGFHKDLHRPTDDADKINYEKVQKISQLTYELIQEMGNREEVFEEDGGSR